MVELTKDEKISKAREHQEQANAAFKEKNFSQAADLFVQAVALCELRQCLDGENRALRLKLCENAAMAANKAEQYSVAIKYATYALWLDLYSIKALYQRSLAHMKSLQWRDAFCDCQLALEVKPKDQMLNKHA